MILTVQIVNYNSRGALLDCLDSVLKNRPENIEMQIIVVNNELEEIGNDLSAFPEAEIIEVGRNLGFGRAHNLGAKQARGKFIFFLNPDARVFPGSIARLVDIFGSDEKIGVVGPL